MNETTDEHRSVFICFYPYHQAENPSRAGKGFSSAFLRGRERNVASASSRQKVLLTQKDSSRPTCPAARDATIFPPVLRLCA